MWSFIRVIFHQHSLPSGWSFINTVFHQGGLSPIVMCCVQNDWFFSNWTQDHYVPMDSGEHTQPSITDTRVPRDDDGKVHSFCWPSFFLDSWTCSLWTSQETNPTTPCAFIFFNRSALLCQLSTKFTHAFMVTGSSLLVRLGLCLSLIHI